MLYVKEKGTDDKVSKEITAVVQNDAVVEQAVLDGTLATDTVNNTLLKPREYISQRKIKTAFSIQDTEARL